MSKDTIRRALTGRPARETTEDKGTGKVFVLTRDQVAAAFAVQRATYDERGYHTFRYWRETTEGAAAVGSALLSALEEAAPELFAALYAAAACRGGWKRANMNGSARSAAGRLSAAPTRTTCGCGVRWMGLWKCRERAAGV